MNKSNSKNLWIVAAFTLVVLTGCNKHPETDKLTQTLQSSAVNTTDSDADMTNDSEVDMTTDSDVATNVKMALMNDPILKSFDIQIISTKGDVRLIGALDNQDQIDAAIKLAHDAKGTHAIHDELTIKE